jgi:energy-coupling factor transporter ATP-binding protein EcfA2
VLTLEAASYRHAGAATETLREVSLTLHEGELAALTGASGSGLSTLCLVLGGLAPRVVGGELQGHLRLDGQDTSTWPMHRFPEHVVVGLGRPAAQLSLVVDTVFEEVAFGPANLGRPRDELVGRTWAALEAIGIAPLAGRDPRRLSGGEQQLVVLAGLLAMGARHLVLDGPLAHLDPTTRDIVLDVLRRHAAEGHAVLVAEHRPHLLAGGCDTQAHLVEGRLVREPPGTPPESGGRAASAPAPLERSPVHPATARTSGSAPDIVLEGVTHRYPTGVMALEAVDLTIRGGETVAIMGRNGSGKTTLVRHLDGLLRPTSGRVRLGGEDVARRSVAQLAGTVALGFQDPDRQIFARSVRAEVELGPRQLRREPRVRDTAVERALDAVGLADEAASHPADLPEGSRRLLALASLLAMECPILVLDEPTAGLDDAGAHIVERIVAAERALGHTVIAVSHDDRFVARSFERVVRLDGGRIVDDGALVLDEATDRSQDPQPSTEGLRPSRLSGATGQLPGSRSNA